MANWANPTLTSTYVNLVTEVKDRDLDLAKGLDPALVTATNLVTGVQRWNSVNNYWEKYNGTAWAALSSAYAINISGSAATAVTSTSATNATNATNIGITNDASTTTAYPVFVTANTGNLPSRVSSTKLSFNANSGVLTASGFNGPLTGTATVAATLASTLGVSLGGTGVSTISGLLFGNGTAAVTAATGAQIVYAIGGSVVNTSTNLAGGAANTIAYQFGTGSTSFIGAPSIANTVLSWSGTGFTWVAQGATVASDCIYENSRTISANYTITYNKSAMSTGPITIANGVTVEIPTGCRWVIL